MGLPTVILYLIRNGLNCKREEIISEYKNAYSTKSLIITGASFTFAWYVIKPFLLSIIT